MKLVIDFIDDSGLMTAAQEKEIADFCQSFLTHLWPRRRNDIFLDIVINDEPWDDDAIAYAGHTGEDQAEIEFNGTLLLKENREYLLETLAHELTHVKQYIKGELKEGGPGSVVWKGESVLTALSMCALTGKALTPEMYKAQPWEEEAYRRQDEWRLFDE